MADPETTGAPTGATSLPTSTLPPQTRPPMHGDPWDLARMSENWRRRMLLYGFWAPLAATHLSYRMGAERADVAGAPDTGVCLFKAAMEAKATLFDVSPMLTGEVPAEVEIYSAALDASGLPSLAPRHQRDTLGIRECALKVAATGTWGDKRNPARLQWRQVFPDMMWAEADPDDPTRPIEYWEAVERSVDGKDVWTFDHVSVRDPEHPVWRVLAADLETDITIAVYGEEYSGDAYPYRDEAGNPLLDLELYHSAVGSALWDSWAGIELVDATLQSAVNWTCFGTAVYRSSHLQRYAYNAKIRNEAIQKAGTAVARRGTLGAPEIIQEWGDDPDAEKPGSLGAFPAPQDIEKIAAGNMIYDRRIIGNESGLAPTDAQRLAADARSGVAIALSFEGRRQEQRRFAPIWAPHDTRMLTIGAAALRSRGVPIRTSGWGWQYQALPPSLEEREAERKGILELLAQGLISKVTAYQRFNPGLTEAQAMKDLQDIARINAQTR